MRALSAESSQVRSRRRTRCFVRRGALLVGNMGTMGRAGKVANRTSITPNFGTERFRLLISRGKRDHNGCHNIFFDNVLLVFRLFVTLGNRGASLARF